MILLTDNDKQFYAQEGYIVLKHVFEAHEMEEAKEALFEIWLDNVSSRKIDYRFNQPLEALFPTLHETNRYNKVMNNLIMDDRNFAIARNLLEREVLIYGTTCFFKSPGSSPYYFHQDNVDTGITIHGRSCAVWVSIDHASRENGGLCILPRSHKLGLLSLQAPKESKYGLLAHKIPEIGEDMILPDHVEAVFVDTEPGDAVIFDGNTVHCSMPNGTNNAFRRSFVTHFLAEDTEKAYGNYNHLIDKHGQIIRKPLNKKHSIIRQHLLPNR